MDAEHTAATDGSSKPATGYRLLLPSQWAQVPLRQGTEEAVGSILKDLFSRIPEHLPPDKIGPYKKVISARFRSSVTQAQQKNGLDLYVPVKPVGDQEFNLGASILVTETTLPEREPGATFADPTDLVVQLLSRERVNADLSSGEVDGAVAVRREFVAEADPTHGVDVASRRIEYIASVPGDPARWFVAAFSTVGGGNPRDELAEVLVEWFDAVMATFRWRFE
ncbi:hypothetical protein QWL27_12635 [Streptomyces thermocarboxydus]|jgi:hypothetical protein|uniref:hypothetical protein n=1 Tax=Streptomyces TaxID=1883 RepID=UPI0010BFB9F0|nr:hypothetical protein [Streptomyces sp. AC04842]MDN3286615.1 hypothetical protein [Streptomyces thermocarboxydus]MDX3418754.1 hypothetical protein [Streptomyces sp. MD20-1-1]WTC17230.1 hypothetical protein OH709_15750 [Streptomyces cellulosae]GHE62367.1 hypothetical protein GCM10018771_50200 [Streptomyces cellulosae]